jgi:hypothetical protein
VVGADEEGRREGGVGAEQERGVLLEVVGLRQQPTSAETVEMLEQRVGDDRKGLHAAVRVERVRAGTDDHAGHPAGHGGARVEARPQTRSDRGQIRRPPLRCGRLLVGPFSGDPQCACEGPAGGSLDLDRNRFPLHRGPAGLDHGRPIRDGGEHGGELRLGEERAGP